MSGMLKEDNKLSLYGVVLANVLVFFGVTNSNLLISFSIGELLKSVDSYVPAGVGLVLTSLLNSQLSSDVKNRIVFLRWRHALPSCEAFSRYVHEDPRINIQALRASVGEFPQDATSQGQLWYSLYKPLDREPAVLTSHKDFLFYRDYSCFSYLFFFVFGLTTGFVLGWSDVYFYFQFALLLQILLTSRAARVSSRRMVTTVLAIKSAQEEKRNGRFLRD